MKTIHNEQGIALITTILITMISLVIVAGLLYTVIQNTKMTGRQKIYRNAVEASYAGADMTMKEILPSIFLEKPAADIMNDYNLMELKISNTECFTHKLFNDFSEWKNKCPDEKSRTVNPLDAPDLEFYVKGPSNRKAFKVFAKIADTSAGVPYLDPGGAELLGAGVTASSGSGTTKGAHYIYRIEVLGQKDDNPAEKGRLTILYEY